MAQRMTGAGVATLAALLALGVPACSEGEVEQAGEDIQAAAEEAAEAAQDVMEEAAAAVEEAVDSLRTPAPDGARVYFVNLQDGDVVQSPVHVVFGAEGVGVTTAGDQTEGTGHHHLLIDTTADSLDLNAPIPNDANHMHFGMAQTEADVELAPGQHTLQLVMGDWTHIPHEPVVASEVITITVE